MLCICQSLYCLSNMLLLLCFLVLCYFYIRGRINIFYDQNDILDTYDQALFSLCLISCLVIAIELVYPHLYIQLIDRLLMLFYQLLLLLVMMKIHQIPINKVVVGMVAVWLAVGGFAIYGISESYLDLSKEQGKRCLKTSFFVISIVSQLTSFSSLYLGISDLKQVRLAEQQRTVEPATQGLRKIIYTEIKRRKVYVKVLIFSSFIASTFLVIVDWQQIAKTVCCSEQSLFLAEMLGNVFAFLIINGIEPLSVYYLMIWRNSKYLSKKAKEEEFRKSNAAMIELESYQRIH